MYARHLILVLVFFVAGLFAKPDTCTVDADCPLELLPFLKLEASQKCIDRDCQIQIRGQTCGRCGEAAVDGKCCDVDPDAEGQCSCVEPPCARKTDCLVSKDTYPPIFAECIEGACTDPEQDVNQD